MMRGRCDACVESSEFHVECVMVGGYAVAEVTVRGLISILFHRPH